MNRANLLRLGFASLMFSLPASSCAGEIHGYIYDGATKGDQRAIVINIATTWVGVQNRSDASIDAFSNGFGGEFRDCGNKLYFCIVGPLNFAIPKKLTHFKQKYEFNGMSCESVATKISDVYRITCMAGGRVASVMNFSMIRGVLSFRDTPIGGRDLFKLRGSIGLFSNGQR
jgi:hypothetical protein